MTRVFAVVAVLAVLMLGLAGALASAPAARAAAPPPARLGFTEMGGKMVIVDEDGENRREIGIGGVVDFSADGATVYVADKRPGYSATASSGGPIRTITPDNTCRAFAASADGRNIAYGWGCDAKYGNRLVVSRADGSDRHVYTEGVTDPRWSPDSRWLAWNGANLSLGTPSGLVTLFDRSTGTTRRVASGNLYGWSPDGTWLAVADGDDSGTQHLVIEHADGSGRRTLASGPSGVAWSPDSRKLVVGTGPDISIVDAATGKTTALTTTHDDQGVGYLDWSPDGSIITFMEPPNSPPPFSALQLIGIAPDGSNRRVIFGGDVALHAPAFWAPDGQAIAVEGDLPSGTDALFIVNPITGKATRVSVHETPAGGTGISMIGAWGRVSPASTPASTSRRAQAAPGSVATTSTTASPPATTTSTTEPSPVGVVAATRHSRHGRSGMTIPLLIGGVVVVIGLAAVAFKRLT